MPADPQTTGQIGAGALGAVMAASGLPLPVVLATTLGALIVVSNTKRVAWSRRAIAGALLAFALALVLGFAGGQILVWFVVRSFPDIPALPVQVLGSIICAMYGQRHLLPKLMGKLGAKIDGGDL